MKQVSRLPFVYNVVIEGEKRQVEIDWGNSPDWMDVFRDDLDNAKRISLVPKDKAANNLPIIAVYMDGDKRWVVGSRVFGQIADNRGVEMRIYFIGWQMTVGGVNIKSIHWVYPGGAIECADDPTLVNYFLAHVG